MAGVFTHTSSEPVPMVTRFCFSGEVIQPRPLPFGICFQSYVGCAPQMLLRRRGLKSVVGRADGSAENERGPALAGALRHRVAGQARRRARR